MFTIGVFTEETYPQVEGAVGLVRRNGRLLLLVVDRDARESITEPGSPRLETNASHLYLEGPASPVERVSGKYQPEAGPDAPRVVVPVFDALK